MLPVAAVASVLLCADLAVAGKPGGGGSAPPPNPVIVYTSSDNSGVTGLAAIRGVTLGSDGVTATDTGLVNAANNRVIRAIAWSPDGSRFAWVDDDGVNQFFRAAALDGSSSILYDTSSDPGTTQVNADSDGFAWGPNCERTDSVLAFMGGNPYAVRLIRASAGAGQPPLQITPTLGTTNIVEGARAFAFSPTGQHLAFFGSIAGVGYGVMVMPMCSSSYDPRLLVPESALRDSPNIAVGVVSMDWSPDGKRLAVSYYRHDDLDPWHDVKIIDLASNYSNSKGVEDVTGYGAITTMPGTAGFGFESSEHSPTWGPAPGTSNCQRLAFARSTKRGRYIYLVDIPTAAGITCQQLPLPQQIASKGARAIDWK
jgi:WD40 repeat protein